MSTLLDAETLSQIKEIFQNLIRPVSLIFFVKKAGCDSCEQTVQLLSEVAALSDKVALQIHDVETDSEKAAQYNVRKAPTLIVGEQGHEGVMDVGVHFMGIPAGHEFTSLINAVLLVSTQEVPLRDSTKRKLQSLSTPVDIKVFTTPTCPYCPQAVILAHQFAAFSPMINSSMVNAIEYQAESRALGVQGVPHTSINDGEGTLIGVEPEEALLDEIMSVAAKKEKK